MKHIHVDLKRALGLLSAVVCLGIVLAACGDDSKKPNQPDEGDPGVYGELADLLEQPAELFEDGNAELNTSLDHLGPYIAAVLDHVPSAKGDDVADGSCLPPGARSKLFQFNGSSYTGTVLPELETAARFQLYAIRIDGTPITNEPIGFFEVSCLDYEDGRQVFAEVHSVDDQPYFVGLRETGDLFDLSGEFWAGTEYPTLVLRGRRSATAGRTSFTATDQFAARVDQEVLEGGASRVDLFCGRTDTPAWTTTDGERFAANLFAGPDGSVQSGYATYHDSSSPRLVACIETGTIDNPEFSTPDGGCLPDVAIGTANRAELKAMERIYGALLALDRVVGRCIAPVAPLAR